MISRRKFLGGLVAAGATAALGRAAAAAAANVAATKKQAASPDYQIGCYTRPWDKHDYRVALDGIAEAGYRYAGLMTASGAKSMVTADATTEQVATMAAEAKSRGLTIISVWGDRFMLTPDVARGIPGLRRLIDHAALCGSPGLLIGGTSKPEMVEPYFKVVAECCDYAAEKNIIVSVKPHGGQNSTGPQCRALIERVGKKNFQLWYDPGNIFHYSEGERDPVEDAPTVDGLVCGMSVKDWQRPKNVLVTPGTGLVDFPKVLRALHRGGFTRGPLVVECTNPGEPAATVTEARKAREFVENLVRQLSTNV